MGSRRARLSAIASASRIRKETKEIHGFAAWHEDKPKTFVAVGQEARPKTNKISRARETNVAESLDFCFWGNAAPSQCVGVGVRGAHQESRCAKTKTEVCMGELQRVRRMRSLSGFRSLAFQLIRRIITQFLPCRMLVTHPSPWEGADVTPGPFSILRGVAAPRVGSGR